jgi:mono/diheme cytochrome c family protein
MKTKIIISLAFGLLMSASFVKANPDPPVGEGKTIFISRCASCHNINKLMTGPALTGVDERRSIDWIINFIHSSQTMVKNGDKDAVALFEKFNKVPMPDHPDLTDENIKSIVEYIKSESKSAAEEKAPFAKPGKKRPNYTPLSINDYGFFAGFLAVVACLILALLFAVNVATLKYKKNGAIIS